MTQEKVHRLSSKGTKLLLQVIKAIIKRFREILEKETFERDSRERDSEKETLVAELADLSLLRFSDEIVGAARLPVNQETTCFFSFFLAILHTSI